jgi:hypothetical protein
MRTVKRLTSPSLIPECCAEKCRNRAAQLQSSEAKVLCSKNLVLVESEVAAALANADGEEIDFTIADSCQQPQALGLCRKAEDAGLARLEEEEEGKLGKVCEQGREKKRAKERVTEKRTRGQERKGESKRERETARDSKEGE